MIIDILEKIYGQNTDRLKKWAAVRVFGLFIFNVVIMLLILLYTAGYFAPFFPLTINAIFFVSLILAIFLLGITGKVFFTIALGFWLLAALLRIANIGVWAERTAIYSYQSLIVGLVLTIIELRRDKV